MSENDLIFKNSVRYDDKTEYPAAQPLEQRAAQVRDIILESVMLGRLDKTDLRIIAARDCSPMPSMRTVARDIGITHQAVSRRVARIRQLFIA